MNKKIKVQPLTCTKGNSVESVGKSITDIMSFMFSVVEDTNKAIVSINKAIDTIPSDYNVKLDEAAKNIVSGIKIPKQEKYDDSKILSELKKLHVSVASSYDETNVIKEILGISNKIPAQYNDENIVSSVKDLAELIKSLHDEVESVKKAVALNQAEIRSYRNITGGQLDEMRRKLDKLTEIK